MVRHQDERAAGGRVVLLEPPDYNAAQELFLRSPTPTAALEMRKDMKQWDEAMELAEQFAPEQLSEISREYGGLLEMRGEYEEARRYFEIARDDLLGPPPKLLDAEYARKGL